MGKLRRGGTDKREHVLLAQGPHLCRGSTPFSTTHLGSVMCSKTRRSRWSHCPPPGGGRGQRTEEELRHLLYRPQAGKWAEPEEVVPD